MSPLFFQYRLTECHCFRRQRNCKRNRYQASDGKAHGASHAPGQSVNARYSGKISSVKAWNRESKRAGRPCPVAAVILIEWKLNACPLEGRRTGIFSLSKPQALPASCRTCHEDTLPGREPPKVVRGRQPHMAGWRLFQQKPVHPS